MRVRLLGLGIAVALTAALAGAAAPTKVPRGVVSISTPGFPGAVGDGFGSMWVISHRGGTIYRVDPDTNGVAAQIEVGEAMCMRPVFGARRVWISNCPGVTGVAETYIVDPDTNRVVGRRSGMAPSYGAGSLWLAAADRKTLLRTDPQSGVVLARINLRVRTPRDGVAHPLGAAYGSQWVTTPFAVSRVNTNTNRVTAVIRLPGAKDWGARRGGYLYGSGGAFAGGKVWVTNPAGVYAIDPASNAAKRLKVKIAPLRELGDLWMTVGRHRVWVRTGNRTVVGINPATGRVEARRPADPVGGGGGLDAAYGSLWVANAGADTVWRERLP